MRLPHCYMPPVHVSNVPHYSSSVQSLRRVRLFATPWTAAHRASLSITISWSSLKPMTNLDNILKSRDITLLTKIYIVKAMVFPVVIYGCESWTIMKSEGQKIDAFKLWVLEKTPEYEMVGWYH